MIAYLEIIIGFVLDWIFGDPHTIKHPVQRIGAYISFIDKKCKQWTNGNATKELWAGGFLLVTTVIGSYAITWGILFGMRQIHPILESIVEAYIIYRILASKSLMKETMKVYHQLKKGDLLAARKAVSYLVGRDTQQLTKEEVAKATVETIAENTSDGVIAPLFYIAIGGAPLGMAYKAINTLDSMVGYRNDEYEYFGKCSALCDDIVNLIPARVSAIFMLGIAVLLGYDGKKGIEMYARDRYQHLSPNSAHTESVVAGVLNIQLGGTHTYFGKIVVKPNIGDDIRPIEWDDIKRANMLMYGTTLLMIVVIGVCYTIVH